MPYTPPKLSAAVEAEIALTFPGEDPAPKDQEALQLVPSKELDIFGPRANPEKRYVSSFEQVAQYAKFLKGLGLRVVYTAGVWDMPHIGHSRYLQSGKQMGDILIVGVELDSAVRIRKGPHRPVVPFVERVEMLCHLRHVDLVVPISDYDERGFSGMGMVEAIKPDVVVVSERSFNEAEDTKEWVARLKKISGGEVCIFESQAETSTSAKIRDLVLHFKNTVNKEVEGAEKVVNESLNEFVDTVTDALKKSRADIAKAQKAAFSELKRRTNEVE